jgi:signal transduction histidine kinase
VDCRARGHSRFEWVFEDINGFEFWIEIVLTTITLNNEELVHVVWRDISDKKQLEQENLSHNTQLITTNKQLEKSIKHLQSAQQQLIESEKMASLGGLVAGVAHEINTPVGIGLTAVTHFLEINNDIGQKYQQQSMTKNDFIKYLEASKEIGMLLNRNLERTAQLVSSFKQVSVDQTSDKSRTFNVLEYINEILTSIHHVIKNSQITINVYCDKDLTIKSCPGAISQIISNLVINASIHAFSKQSGMINISATSEGKYLNLIIEDDGAGISEKNINKIFEPFYTTNRDNGGSGLGLNIVYNIVTTQLSGSISCDSKIDYGTTFTITFPIIINDIQ